jgi:hypothetical protein
MGMGGNGYYDADPGDCPAGVGAARDFAASGALNPALQTFAQWLAENRSRVPIA